MLLFTSVMYMYMHNHLGSRSVKLLWSLENLLKLHVHVYIHILYVHVYVQVPVSEYIVHIISQYIVWCISYITVVYSFFIIMFTLLLIFLGKYYFYIQSLLIVILLIRLLSHNPQGVLCQVYTLLAIASFKISCFTRISKCNSEICSASGIIFMDLISALWLNTVWIFVVCTIKSNSLILLVLAKNPLFL